MQDGPRQLPGRNTNINTTSCLSDSDHLFNTTCLNCCTAKHNTLIHLDCAQANSGLLHHGYHVDQDSVPDHCTQDIPQCTDAHICALHPLLDTFVISACTSLKLSEFIIKRVHMLGVHATHLDAGLRLSIAMLYLKNALGALPNHVNAEGRKPQPKRKMPTITALVNIQSQSHMFFKRLYPDNPSSQRFCLLPCIAIWTTYQPHCKYGHTMPTFPWPARWEKQLGRYETLASKR